MRSPSCILLAVLAGLPAAAHGQLRPESNEQSPAKVLPPRTTPSLDTVMPPSGGLVAGGRLADDVEVDDPSLAEAADAHHHKDHSGASQSA